MMLVRNSVSTSCAMIWNMKPRSSALAVCIIAVFGISLSLTSCSSSSSTDTTVATEKMAADTTPAMEETPMEESSEADDMSGSSAYCTNATPLKALNLKAITSDTAGGAAMALDSVMGEFDQSLQDSAAAMQEFLMEAATSASAKDGSTHQATLDEVLKWLAERCK